MKKTYSAVLNIQKPEKPHRQVKMEEKPSELEIRKRYERIEKLKKLGIDTTILDMEKMENEEFEEDVDKLQASILIMQDKEVPKELEEKILTHNKEKISIKSRRINMNHTPFVVEDKEEFGVRK